MPLISVCVPVYNVEMYIGRCLKSIQNQTLHDIEIILVNDNSPDSSMSIVAEYAAYDSRIKILHHESNQGLMIARKTAYMAASGDYIAFCDSDDMLPQNALELLYNYILSAEADIASGEIQRFTDFAELECVLMTLKYGNDSLSVYKSLLKNEYSHSLCGKLFKRSLLQDYHYISFHNATNGEDGILFYQLLQNATKIVHLNKQVYRYYQNALSSTHIRLSKNALSSIVTASKVRLNTCGKIHELEDLTWVCISKVFNGLLADGYGKTSEFCDLIKNENMQEYINPLKMLKHYSFSDYFATMMIRIIKPLFRK